MRNRFSAVRIIVDRTGISTTGAQYYRSTTGLSTTERYSANTSLLISRDRLPGSEFARLDSTTIVTRSSM